MGSKGVSIMAEHVSCTTKLKNHRYYVLETKALTLNIQISLPEANSYAQ